MVILLGEDDEESAGCRPIFPDVIERLRQVFEVDANPGAPPRRRRNRAAAC